LVEVIGRDNGESRGEKVQMGYGGWYRKEGDRKSMDCIEEGKDREGRAWRRVVK